MTRALRRAMLGAAAVAVAAAALGVGVRSTHGGHAAVDEPQYLLTALSLWEDGDLDISDELAGERWRAFHDAELPVQTEVLRDGRQISPHDPLLPLLIALPMGLGGWLAAKLTLAALVGACAALCVWLAVRRLSVPPRIAGAGVALAFASPPLAIYGGQVYPELPAATVVVLAVAAMTGSLRLPALLATAASVVALPWLSVKYAPVAAALAAIALWRLVRSARVTEAIQLASALVVAAAGFLLAHRLVWGGWTAYSSGDHFAQTGEFSVIGVSPDYVGRSLRLVGLLFDRHYGLVPWQLAWLLVVPAAAALLRRRPRHAAAILLPVAAAWATATWIALTMHGFWWPGRQVVVVLPLLVLGVLWWLTAVAGPRLRVASVAMAATGPLLYATLLLDGWAREITWVTGFQNVDNPLYAGVRLLLPDYGVQGPGFWLRHVALICLVSALAIASWRQAGRSDAARHPADTAPPEEPVGARSLTSA
jgi:hypothetical protein